jgi:hypothetical protein
MERVHRFNCPVAPNTVVEKPSRAELSKHAQRSDPDAEAELYEAFWSDTRFEQDGGR